MGNLNLKAKAGVSLDFTSKEQRNAVINIYSSIAR